MVVLCPLGEEAETIQAKIAHQLGFGVVGEKSMRVEREVNSPVWRYRIMHCSGGQELTLESHVGDC